VHVTRVEVEEGISRPFRIRVEGVTNQVDMDPDTLVKTIATVTCSRSTFPDRFWSGMVRSAGTAGTDKPGLQTLSIEIVPTFWFTGQTEDCRIWQDKTAQQILTDVLNENGITDVEWRCQGLVARPYTVQYNETDYAFATRLMQDEGIFYFFKHASGTHTMVIANSNAAFTAIPDSDLTFHTGRGWRKDVSAFRGAGQTVLGEVVLRDYNLTTPDDRLEATETTVLATGHAARRKFFVYPGNHSTVAEGRRKAKIMMEAAEAQAKMGEGMSAFEGLTPGGKFTLDSVSGTQVVHAVTHRMMDNDNSNNPDGFDYANSFSCFADSVPYRDRATQPRPVMSGVYNAVVDGPAGEEIHTDEYGRIKVKFFWDRLGNSPGNNTCWVRSMQTWAGDAWGFQFIPRVGMEVVLAFLHGNPDYPICVGCLPNANTMPPFALPGQKTRSGIRTHSTVGGGAQDFNELSFQDKAGQEEVFLHAQKDLKVEVENDETRTVDHNRTVTIKNDEIETIHNSRTITVKAADNTLTLDQGNHLQTVKMGNWDLKVKMGNIAVKADMGNITIKASLGSITLEAMQGITLKVGTSTLKLDMTGVKIAGMMTEMKGTAMATVAAPMLQLKGDGMAMLKGGIVMIN
jgi:type VI secretion system secreted protein VgrG